ncbi:MAG: lauroyl acyltransferase [Rhodobacteraceae bacterium CG17_big_fil_post_rev_8_21_14_2_50_63_15]|nr:MAG: lauroyl acyltransferase [Rhodobacteraceae bacterium CG17_big_fil_post_rev_8_21_14_2_50_63_15]
MAKFILGNTLRHKALESPLVSRALWFFDLLLVGAILGLFKILPVAWASAMGGRLGRVFGKILYRRNQYVRANLSLALPDRSPGEIDRLASDVWSNAGAVMAEYPHLRKIVDPKRDFLEIEIIEQIPAYSDPNKSAVFISAHIANWEVAAAAITRLGIRQRIMYAPLANPWLDQMMLHFRAALGGELVSRGDGLRVFLNALNENRSVAIVADRRIEGGKPLAFFGEERESSVLPGRLALRYQVPLVPIEVERLPGARFRIRFHAPLRPRDPEADLDAQINDLGLQVNEKFESWIRARPGQWLCTSKIWPTTVLLSKTDVYKTPK